jgi:hypothetical protein
MEDVGTWPMGRGEEGERWKGVVLGGGPAEDGWEVLSHVRMTGRRLLKEGIAFARVDG